MARILVVSYLFPPAGGSGVVRTAKLARHLGSHGVVPVFLASRDPAPYADPGREAEIPEGTVVERCPGLLPVQWRPRPRAGGERADRRRRRPRWRDVLRGWVSVPDRAIFWAPLALRRGLRMGVREACDAVYGPGGPWTNLLVARALARRLGLPLVVDFKEAWGAGPPLGWPNGPRRDLERRWERAIVGDSALVICASTGLREDLLRRIPGLRPRKVTVVPNGYEPEDYPRRPEPPATDELRVVHTGYLSRAFSVRPVLAGLAAAVARGARVRVRFVGEADEDVSALARAVGVGDRVEVVGPVSYRESVREQVGAGALLVLEGRSPLPGGAMPSKVYEYLGARRPILAVARADSLLSRFLESLGLPGAVEPGRPREIADRLEALASGRGQVPAPEAVAGFRWPDLVGRIARAVRTVVRRERSRAE